MSPSPALGKNVVHDANGVIHEFPSDATPEEMQAAMDGSSLEAGGWSSKLKENGTNFKPPLQGQPQQGLSTTYPRNPTIDMLRNILPPAAGAAAATVATPYTGGLGTFAAGTAGYTGMDQLLKSMKSGTSSESIPASLMDSLTSAVINEAGGRIIGGVWKGAKAFAAADQPEILKFLPTASQALKAQGTVPTVSRLQ